MIIHRTMVDDDRSYILDTFRHWCKTQQQCRIAGWLTMSQVMRHLMDTWLVTVACEDEETSAIIGYIVHQADNAAFLYVRDGFRGQGVARRLVDSALGNPFKVFTVFPFPDNSNVKNRIDHACSPWIACAD